MDHEAAEEERILRAMSRKPAGQQIQAGSKPSNRHSVAVTNLGSKQQLANALAGGGTGMGTGTGTGAPVKTASVVAKTEVYATKGGSNDQIEQLQLKKRTLLGTIGSTKREIEEVRNEIAKLKAKETELLSLLEKREAAVHQLSTQIEDLERQEESDRANADEIKKRQEEERARRVREDIERRKREEDEEESRKRREEEERRKNIVNSSVEEVGNCKPSSIREDDDFDKEEERLMRAMKRGGIGGAAGGGGGGGIPLRASSVKPPTQKVPTESDRRAAEERKKEEERRIAQEQEAKRVQQEQAIAHLLNRPGTQHTFVTPAIYDYDADVTIAGDFTDWKEIPIQTDIDSKFTKSISLPVSPGVHFYHFRINGKWEINRNATTGVSPTGELMNKVDVN